MKWQAEWKPLAAMTAVFLLFYFLPERYLAAWQWLPGPAREALLMTREYAREHVLLCLVPALFIAGAVAVFVSQAAVMKYLGPRASKPLAYGVASVSGGILAVCSCTILPLFAGIYRMGAGLGPACAFLYAGPAINILAIVLTASVLGPQMGVARALGAVFFSLVIGLLMHLFFRREEMEKMQAAPLPAAETARPLWQNALYFAVLVGILVFANWGRPAAATGIWLAIYAAKWQITGILAAALALILVLWFHVGRWRMVIAAAPVLLLAIAFPEQPAVPFVVGVLGLSTLSQARAESHEMREWLEATWDFAKKILPLLFYGVLIAGFLLGRPGHQGLLPADWIVSLVGGNSLGANLFASVAGAFMYFATLTEIPILQGLMGSGMGKGPALALLLAGPALSLPNMLVIRSVMGANKTVVFVALVIAMATLSGVIYGAYF